MEPLDLLAIGAILVFAAGFWWRQRRWRRERLEQIRNAGFESERDIPSGRPPAPGERHPFT